MEVHVARSRNKNGVYTLRYCRIPQVQGDYLISDLKAADEIEFSFQVSTTEQEKASVFDRWGHKIFIKNKDQKPA